MNVGCGCLAMFVGPRLVLFFAWLAGLGPSFETAIWPFLGFLFMPWTTLCYAIAAYYCGFGNDFSIGWTILMILCVLADLGTISSASKEDEKHV